MMRAIQCSIFSMGLFSIANGSVGLDSKYTICYGNPKAPIQIVEYLSFGCTSCIRSFAEEFGSIRKAYIESGEVYWVFHPHPVDLITVQGMVCLEALNDHQKRVFMEAVFLEHYHSPKFDVLSLMMAAMKVLKIRIPDVMRGETLQTTTAFKAAFAYQQSKPEFSGTPTIFFNGKMIDAFPTREIIGQLIQEEQGKTQ